jgi:hypothetical protein
MDESPNIILMGTHRQASPTKTPLATTNQKPQTGSMFARKIRVEYEQNDQRHPCPLKWLDSFSMRNFTNATVFDDTLPVADGLMEVGVRVPLGELKTAMEDWFHRKSYLPKAAGLLISEDHR